MKHKIAMIFAAALLSACGGSSIKPDFWNEYKIDVQQGNVLSQDAVSQLKVGMNQAQVQQLLGSPTLKDVFHKNRWDYPYQYLEGPTGEKQVVLFSVFFDDEGNLSHVSGDIESRAREDLPETQSKIRLIELSKLSEEDAQKPLAPREPPSMYQRIKRSLGFGSE